MNLIPILVTVTLCICAWIAFSDPNPSHFDTIVRYCFVDVPYSTGLDRDLQRAVDNNDIVQAIANIRAGANVNQPTVYGSLLQRAVRDNYTDMVKLLLEAGADVNYIDSTSHIPTLLPTALHIAYAYEYTVSIKLLEQYNALPIKNVYGKTAQETAQVLEDRDETRDLINAIFIKKIKHNYVEAYNLFEMSISGFGNVELMELVLNYSTEITANTLVHNIHPLIHCIRRNSVNGVMKLLLHGAKPMNNDFEVLSAVLRHIEIDDPSYFYLVDETTGEIVNHGRTMLMCLLMAGFDPKCTNKDGVSLIDTTRDVGAIELLRSAIDMKALY